MKTLFLKPLITEKSLALSNEGVFQFLVPTWADKDTLQKFITHRFNVTVEAIRTSRMHGERVMFRRQPGHRADYKKVTVQLKKGDTIADFSLPAETTATPESKQDKKSQATIESPSESKITVRSRSKKRKS